LVDESDKQAKENKMNILPDDAAEAVKKMTGIVREMKELAEHESKILGTQNLEALKKLIAVKDTLSKNYEQAAAEFHRRAAEFRGVGVDLLTALKDEQEAMQSFVKHNSAYYEAAKAKRAGKK
jgi:hypothetical protein